MTYNGHISDENATSVPRSIPYLAWKSCGKQQHGVFLHTPRNHALVEPEMERKIRMREYITIWKLRLRLKKIR
jgi:hypothetical protein